MKSNIDSFFKEIKNKFPIFNKKINGKEIIFLDTAASSQKPQSVIDSVSICYSENYANIHRGVYYLSSKLTRDYELVRENIASFINAKNEYNSNDGKVYINLIITKYDTKNDNLENIYTNKIPIEDLNKNTILEDITFISYNNISKWWKKETVTYFDKINTIVCGISEKNINLVQKVKNKISSITQFDSILLKTLN